MMHVYRIGRSCLARKIEMARRQSSTGHLPPLPSLSSSSPSCIAIHWDLFNATSPQLIVHRQSMEKSSKSHLHLIFLLHPVLHLLLPLTTLVFPAVDLLHQELALDSQR